MFDKYSELAGKSVLADVFLKMHCYNLQIKADLLHKLNMEQTGSSLVFALRHNQYLTIFAEFTWLMEWMQYSLFGGNLLRDDSFAIALAMARFSTQLQEFPVKIVERLHKVLESVSTIHDLCVVLSIDFLRIVTKVYPRLHDFTGVNSEKLDAKGDCKKKQIADPITIIHLMRSSGIDEAIVRAGETRNIASVFLRLFVELNPKMTGALNSKLHMVFAVGVLALPSPSLKDFFDALSLVSGFILWLAKHNEGFVVSLGLKIVTRLPLNEIAAEYVSLYESFTFPPLTLLYWNLAILYELLFHLKVGDFSIFTDSMILEDYFDSILSGLLYVHTLTLTGVHTLTLTGCIEHVTSSYVIKVWDPRRKWCAHRFILKCNFALTSLSSNHLEMSTPNKERTKMSSKDLFVFPCQPMSFVQENCWHIILIFRAMEPREMDNLGLSLFSLDFVICYFYKLSELCLVNKQFTAYSVHVVMLLTLRAGILALEAHNDRMEGESNSVRLAAHLQATFCLVIPRLISECAVVHPDCAVQINSMASFDKIYRCSCRVATASGVASWVGHIIIICLGPLGLPVEHGIKINGASPNIGAAMMQEIHETARTFGVIAFFIINDTTASMPLVLKHITDGVAYYSFECIEDTLFSWDQFGSSIPDPYLVDIAPDLLRRLHQITTMLSKWLYPNLEDKVLIEGGGNVMNVNIPGKDTDGKLENYLWDPG